MKLKNALNKSLKNYYFSIISISIMTILGFIATPIIIKYIGKSQYGSYQLILQYLGYLTICDLGLSTSSCALLSQAWNTQDRKYVIRTIKILLRQYLKTIPLLILVIALIIYIFLNFSLKHYDEDAVYAFIIMALTSFFIPLNVFKDFLLASERSYIISKLMSIQLLIMTCLNIYFSYNGFGIIGLAISFSSLIILFQVIILFIAFRKITLIPIKNIEFNIKVKSIWSQNLHSSLQNILGKLSFATDTIILSFFMPTSIVTNFVTNQKLAIVIDSLLKNIGNSSWASIATLKDDPKELQRAINFFNKLFLLIAFPALFALAANNHHFISLWLGPNFYISNLFTWIAFGNFAFFGIFSFWGWIFLALGKLHLQTKTIVIAGVINVFASVILTYYLNELGPVLGTFISFYGFSIWHLSYIMKKELKLDVSRFFILFSILILIFSLLYPFLEYLKIFDSLTWTSLIANTATCYFIGLIICASILLNKQDHHFLLTMIKKIRGQN